LINFYNAYRCNYSLFKKFRLYLKLKKQVAKIETGARLDSTS
jgi:hypothetical protein